MREVLAAIRLTAVQTPQRIALTDMFHRLSYAELASSIARIAGGMTEIPVTVGLLMPHGIESVLTDLALASLGRTIVALPDFFSIEQYRHMIADAGIEAIVTTPLLGERISSLGIPIVSVGSDGPPLVLTDRPSRRIIYTSGTTGKPKGVELAEAAMSASLAGLRQAVGATADDVHLSILPLSLLLEQLAGILLPLNVGARIHMASSLLTAPREAETARPTTTMLVPDLLAGWVDWLRQSGRSVPSTLRFVGVGGAPVSDNLADLAWSLGLPVHEGYGLSECCSVVSVNRPGQRRAGTVGRPIGGVKVSIDQGEIVVQGPTVMTGYLGGPPTQGIWRTGDLGSIDDDGNLIIHGRKDDLVVTANGRNIHPEWIEPMLLQDRDVRRAAIVAGKSGLKAVLVTTVDVLSPAAWLQRLQGLTASAPPYARPVEVVLMFPERAAAANLFTLDGRPRRRRIAQFLSEVHVRFYDSLIQSTASERQIFLAIPVIDEAITGGVDMALYRSYLSSAYHHVRYTVPLLQAALAACGPEDSALDEVLAEYLEEEVGHEQWILEDIDALGGNSDTACAMRPPLAVRTMVAYAFHLIAEEGPYALLGMIHVLEGMSVALALAAAQSIRARLSPQGDGGFSYLTSHGSLDVEHVETFARLLDVIDTPHRRAVVIAAAKDFYILYGNVFRDLSSPLKAPPDAA